MISVADLVLKLCIIEEEDSTKRKTSTGSRQDCGFVVPAEQPPEDNHKTTSLISSPCLNKPTTANMYFPSAAIAAVLLGALFSVVPVVNAATCETVNSWSALVRLVNTAMREKQGSICFRPFRVMKPTGNRMTLNRPIDISCDKTSLSDQCIIEGDGHQVRIAGGNADVTITGFTFIGATECAIRVIETATKPVNLVSCEFIDNHGSFGGWRGGALKTEPGTTVTVDSCFFESNEAAGGGAIFHRGDQLLVMDSSFTNNRAKEGGAIRADPSTGVAIYGSSFYNNQATISQGGAIEIVGSDLLSFDNVLGSGNSPCAGIYDRENKSCTVFNSNPIVPTPTMNPIGPSPTFVLGELTVSSLGLKLSKGLSAKIIARAGQRVDLTSPERKSDKSVLPFHGNPDGAAVFELKDGGWMYLSNSENANGEGGVYGLEFDSSGRPRDFVSRLTGTTRNCAGGVTPWNTWVSCEEHGKGQCWQVDPTGERKSVKTKLVEPAGGNFESMAYDASNPNEPHFFVTEDHARGALRRFTPICNGVDLSWNLIQLNGDIDYLQFNDDFTFQWTTSLDAGRDSAEKYFKNTEGISFDDGILSFVSKVQKEIFRLDLDRGTYTVESTDRGALPGGGTFGAGPDQIIQFGDLLYLTEDGGGNPGIYVTDGQAYYTLFEGQANKFRADETTGLAFSPDGTTIYACMQEIGYLFEITRDDGLPFPGIHKVSHLRWHNQELK